KLDHDPPPITAHRDVPGPLGKAVMAALARDPSHRPSAEQLAHMLAIADEHKPRGRVLPIIAGIAALVAIIMIGLALRSRSAHELPAADPSPQAKPADPPAKSRPPSFAAPPSGSAAQRPNVVHENGNPVDDETARRILEQMERDARHEYEQMGHG